MTVTESCSVTSNDCGTFFPIFATDGTLAAILLAALLSMSTAAVNLHMLVAKPTHTSPSEGWAGRSFTRTGAFPTITAAMRLLHAADFPIDIVSAPRQLDEAVRTNWKSTSAAAGYQNMSSRRYAARMPRAFGRIALPAADAADLRTLRKRPLGLAASPSAKGRDRGNRRHRSG